MTMKISRTGNTLFISGIIDENADLSSLLQEQAPLSIDFSGVTRINSVGLRTWMRFMTLWGDKPLNYLECPISVTDQIIIIPALRGIKKQVATVVSGVLPYDCPSCRHQADIRVERSQVVPKTDTAVEHPKCPACSKVMDLVNPDQLDIFKP
jgi:hypothetical protein